MENKEEIVCRGCGQRGHWDPYTHYCPDCASKRLEKDLQNGHDCPLSGKREPWPREQCACSK